MGVDPHEPSIDEARRIGGDGLTCVHADALHVELPQADDVTSVAMLHRADMAERLRAVASPSRPAACRSSSAWRRARTRATSIVPDSVGVRLRSRWHTIAPIVWPPPVTHVEARRIAEDVLSGVCYRGEIHLRYTVAEPQTPVEAASVDARPRLEPVLARPVALDQRRYALVTEPGVLGRSGCGWRPRVPSAADTAIAQDA